MFWIFSWSTARTRIAEKSVDSGLQFVGADISPLPNKLIGLENVMDHRELQNLPTLAIQLSKIFSEKDFGTTCSASCRFIVLQ